MDKSNVLLSQPEIDALLDFLAEKKVSSSTMDQASIDRLIAFLQSNEGQHFTPKEIIEDSLSRGTSVLLLPSNENVIQPDSFRLSAGINAEGRIELTCANSVSGNTYKITPTMVETAQYSANDSSYWGCFIAPSLFNHIATILNAKYTCETYDFICKIFAKACYGSEEAAVPNLFLPNKKSLLENMII